MVDFKAYTAFLLVLLGAPIVVYGQSSIDRQANQVIAAASRPTSGPSVSARDLSILQGADRALANDESDSNFRSIFNTNDRPDEFTSNQNVNQAQRGVRTEIALENNSNSNRNNRPSRPPGQPGNDGQPGAPGPSGDARPPSSCVAGQPGNCVRGQPGAPGNGGQPGPSGNRNGGQPGNDGQPGFSSIDGQTGSSEPRSRDDAEIAAKIAAMTDCLYDGANQKPCSSLYREPSGRCNNVVTGRKTWGMADTPFIRKLPPRYEDGTNSRRITGHFSGMPLRNPRKISTTVTTTNEVLNHAGVNSHVMQWGQFIAHEFTQLAEVEAGVACCPDQIASTIYSTPTPAQLNLIRQIVNRVRGDVCMHIENFADAVYRKDVCMTHVRARPATQHQCVPDVRQQSNTITHVFDASAVYGSSTSELNKLRDGSTRRLKFQTVNGRRLPPQNLDGCVGTQRANNRCPFLAGDSRINTTPNLISAHTAFIVCHNDIADELKRINSHWSEEKCFQEARKIVSAIQSNIHFYEWLPIVVGRSTLDRYSLRTYSGHDSNVNPSTLNELATAAMRFGHSLVDGQFTLVKDNGRRETGNLTQLFFDSDIIYQDGVQQCVKGLFIDKPYKVDRNFPEPLRDQLFDDMRDLIALNINRGRDHGLDSYANYRRAYGLSAPFTWTHMYSTHPRSVVDQLKKAYTNVGDVELYIGAVTENPVDGGLVGELFSNILADGFSRLRKGDRFWFEHPGGGLTSAQISAIRDYKYAQLLCEAHGMPSIVSKAFYRDGQNGAKTVSCSSFRKLDLSLWRENTGGSCSWQTVSKGACCQNQRQVTRTCTGTGNCFNRCRGSPVTTEHCICNFFQCLLNDCRNNRLPVDQPGFNDPIRFPSPVRQPGPPRQDFNNNNFPGSQNFNNNNNNFGNRNLEPSINRNGAP